VATEVNARDAKLIQYLNEAYGKEKQLETALQAHITLTTRPPYKKRLQEHLKETKVHAKQLERRIKKLGGTAELGANLPGPDTVTETVANIAGRAVAAAQGPLHALRGTGEAEKMLKNAKDEYHEEAEEIANYTAIEALADLVGDKETAKLAKGIRREEERMQKFLGKLIPQLTKAVAQEEIPAAERRSASSSRRRTRSSSSSRKSSSSGSRASRSRSGASSSRSTSSRSTSARSGGSKSRSSSARSGGSSSRSSSSRSGRSRSKS
jgi:ferritin-like metal-binding protein YciE